MESTQQDEAVVAEMRAREAGQRARLESENIRPQSRKILKPKFRKSEKGASQNRKGRGDHERYKQISNLDGIKEIGLVTGREKR